MDDELTKMPFRVAWPDSYQLLTFTTAPVMVIGPDDFISMPPAVTSIPDPPTAIVILAVPVTVISEPWMLIVPSPISTTGLEIDASDAPVAVNFGVPLMPTPGPPFRRSRHPHPAH